MVNSRINLFGKSDILSIPDGVKTQEQMVYEKKIQEELRLRKLMLSQEITARRKKKSFVTKIAKPIVEGNVVLTVKANLEDKQLCCDFNQDYNLFAAGGTEGIVRLFDSKNGDLIAELTGGKEMEGVTSCVTSIKHRPLRKKAGHTDNCLISTYVNGYVKAFNYNKKTCLFTIKEDRQTYGLLHHPKMPKFLTYGDDFKINLYDYETQKKERIFEKSSFNSADGPSSRVFAACFNPKSNDEFLTGGWNENVHLWDIRTPHAVRFFSGVHLCGEGLDMNNAGSQILTCSWRSENQIQFWDYQTFKLLNTSTTDKNKLYCGRFIHPEYIVCGSGDPPSFRIIDTVLDETKGSIRSLQGDVCNLSLGKFATGKNNGQDSERIDLVWILPKILFTSGTSIYQIEGS